MQCRETRDYRRVRTEPCPLYCTGKLDIFYETRNTRIQKTDSVLSAVENVYPRVCFYCAFCETHGVSCHRIIIFGLVCSFSRGVVHEAETQQPGEGQQLTDLKKINLILRQKCKQIEIGRSELDTHFTIMVLQVVCEQQTTTRKRIVKWRRVGRGKTQTLGASDQRNVSGTRLLGVPIRQRLQLIEQ